MACPQHILINGAGLAGLGLALALAKQNIRSTLFELRASPTTLGGAITLAPNAQRALDKNTIGVLDAVRKVGFEFEKIQLVSDDGMHLGTIANGGRERYGYPAVRALRSNIHGALLASTERYPSLIKIYYDSSIEKIEESQTGVTVTLNKGEQLDGTIVVGADGIHSKVREHILGAKAPQPAYSGFYGVGGVVDRDQVQWGHVTPPAMIFSQFGAFLAFCIDPHGDKIGWAMQRNLPEKTREGWHDYITSGEALKECRDAYSNPPPPISEILSQTKQDSVTGWPPYSIPDLDTWHTSRVVIIGDAAHAIPPHGGQGSAQAFEDAVFLARLLSEPDALKNGYEVALEHFETVRKRRLKKVRELTEASSRSRSTSLSWPVWLLKKYAMWIYFWATGGLEGALGDIYNYDGDCEPLH